MDNKNIADVFGEIGDILEIQGASFFRVNAYRKGALTVMNYPKSLASVVKKTPGELGNIPGIGSALKEKIIELVETGKCQEHEKLKKGFPAGLLEMLKVRGLGPKKVQLFYNELGIKTVEALKKAAEQGKLRDLPKMGEKSEQEIVKAIEEYAQFSTDRFLINDAKRYADLLIEHMQELKSIKQIQYAGSLRRGQETVGDIDILVSSESIEDDGADIMKHFTGFGQVINVIAEGDTKSSVILDSGLQADLRLVKPESFGAALHYFTGSKDHNVKMRDIAKKRGMKVNEYGLFDGEKMIAGKTEKEMFEALDLPFIEPELRKNDGEFEYAAKHKKMPKLIELDDIKGDLHNHSTYSDGKNSIEEMAEAFMKRGYKYFGMTDHSPSLGVTGGLNKEKIKKQWKEIDDLNKKFKGKITILKGCEVDILKELDVVIISAHLHQKLDHDEQTKRLIKAIENPYSNVLGHPTGRLINRRPEMQYDMEKVMKACVEHDVALEINAQPLRLDLSDKYIRAAKELGAKFVINTDSHNTITPEYIEYGVKMARRGWLTKDDVLNTQDLPLFDKRR